MSRSSFSKFSKSPVRQEAVNGDASPGSNGQGSSVPANAGGTPTDSAGFFNQMKSFFTGEGGGTKQPAPAEGLDQFAHFGSNVAGTSQPAQLMGAPGTNANGSPPSASNSAAGGQSGQPNQPAQPNQQQSASGIDPAQLMAAVGNMNFAQSVPQELMTKALAGEADSPEALLKIINSTAQNAFAQSTLLTNNLVNQRLEAMQEKIDAGFSSKMTNLQRQEAVTSNPLLQHPALAPVTSALTASFTAQYANESPAEIQKKVTTYMQSMAGFLNAQMAPTASQQKVSKHAAWQADALDF